MMQNKGDENLVVIYVSHDGCIDMGVSKNRGTPKSSILIGSSIINHPFWDTIMFGNTHMICSNFRV